MSNAAKNFNILVLRNYLNSSTKLLSCISS